MTYFLVVFFIGVLAFGDAFLSIEQGILLRSPGSAADVPQELDGTFYEKYLEDYVASIKASFLVALGEFAIPLEEYDDIDFCFFALCVIFNIIVLLNLLIAIISETYEDIAATQKQTSYKEKTNQLGYVMDTIYGLYKRE